MASIVFPKDGAPEPLPAVVKIGDICYELLGEARSPKDTEWSAVEHEYANCDECQGKKCAFTWNVTYDCSTTSFGSPTLISTDCNVLCMALDWYYVAPIVGDVCTYETVICPGDICDGVGDCSATAPSVPSSPFDCPCPQSSSSSAVPSSSASPSSSSASPGPSSSASPWPGPGPQDDGRFI